MAAGANTKSLDERIRRMEPISVSEQQRREIAELLRVLERAGEEMRTRGETTSHLVGPDGETTRLPDSVFFLLERIAELLVRGDALSLVPVHTELTTQQAADLLNVSRQYLVRLLDEGKIPHTRTGSHRRVRFHDVMKYKQHRDEERLESLDELTRASQEYGGYGEMP